MDAFQSGMTLLRRAYGDEAVIEAFARAARALARLTTRTPTTHICTLTLQLIVVAFELDIGWLAMRCLTTDRGNRATGFLLKTVSRCAHGVSNIHPTTVYRPISVLKSIAWKTSS